jgi:hypothetical protein
MPSALMPNAAKRDLFDGVHLPGHTYKIALFTSAAALGDATTGYTASNEVSGTGYTAGGATLTGRATGIAEGKGYLHFAAPSWTNATITGARFALIYNDTVAGKPSLGVYNFGEDVSSTNGTFSFPDWPGSAGANSILRIA